jgi:porphobilinogen synthase
MMQNQQRPRRNRASHLIRELVAETVVDRSKLIMPHFILEGKSLREPIVSMPGINRVSIDNLLKDLESDHKIGIDKILLFGIPEKKDELASGAYDDHGIVQRAVRAIKKECSKLVVATDVCNCEYTSHGHCGVIQGEEVLNDPSVAILADAALSHARAGADIVAPSDMMDGRVGAIREKLDENGFENVAILSYAAKYCSAFYGPFREAAQSSPQFGDRRSYQMDPANAREALREVALDLEEGADMIMVKPAMPYLDVIQRVRETFDVPVAAYNVSGEYSMVKAAAQRGWLDEKRVVLEILTGIQRAGAGMILTYHAKDVARWLKAC